MGNRPNVRVQQRRPFQQSRAGSRVRTTATANREAEPASTERRNVLLAGALLLAAPFGASQPATAGQIKVENLGGFQKADQRKAFQARVVEELQKVLTKDDAGAAARAVLNDAGTYDVATKTGGFNGSIRFELDRPENKGLKAYFDKLSKAKEAIDAKSAKIGISPISYADLEVMGLRVATRLKWAYIKVSRAPVASGGETISDAFGAAWDVSLGRPDAESADPEGRVLQPSASPQEVKDWFFKLGNTKPEGGFGTGKPPFWERLAYVLWTGAADDQEAEEARLAEDQAFTGWKTKYDRSKKTVTRTEYEVDYITFFQRAIDLGGTRDPLAYLVPLETQALKL
jgi:L-ascorbate peroxidase